MKTIIHVNQHVIKSNRKNGVNDPVNVYVPLYVAPQLLTVID